MSIRIIQAGPATIQCHRGINAAHQSDSDRFVWGNGVPLMAAGKKKPKPRPRPNPGSGY